MPSSHLRPCLGCGQPARAPRCADCATDPRYTTVHWQTIRATRLALDERRCQLRHDGCTATATHVHLDPSLNGQHHLATLDLTTSACAHCHGVEDAPRANGYPPGRGTGRDATATPTRDDPATSTFLRTDLEAA